MIWAAIIFVVFFVLFLPYEIYCVYRGLPTLSYTVTSLSRRQPLVGFLLGFFFGGLVIHLFTEGMQCGVLR